MCDCLAGHWWSLHDLYISSGFVDALQNRSSTIPASFSMQTTSERWLPAITAFSCILVSKFPSAQATRWQRGLRRLARMHASHKQATSERS